MRFQAPKGTKDILPEETGRWHKVEEMVRDVMNRFNYQEIRTPTFEETQLFSRGVGEETDIVQKEMYTFTDRGDRSLTLLPEGTASVVRAYLEHEMGKKSTHTKLFYITRMYRQENPQKGRLRQHTQFGAEAIGSPHPSQDVEIIQVALTIYENLGINNSEIRLNSVGCKKCRPRFKDALKKFLSTKLNSLCSDCQRRYEANPLRILDCKKEGCIRETEEAPRITDYLCEECKEHFEDVKAFLQELDIPYTLTPRLVRGLDYYTRTTFEFISSKLGGQDAIGGGGRYDYLIEELGGDPQPAVGLASGIERLLLVMPDTPHSTLRTPHSLDVFIATIGNEAQKKGFSLLNQLRTGGFICEMDYLNRSLKAQMKASDKQNSRYVYILGEEELRKGKGILRDMESHEQTEVEFEKLEKKMRSFQKEKRSEG
jgi:histidyl-tRNA synthetase